MAGSNVLKEFLVKISFKADEAGKRRFMEGLGAISKQSVSLTKNFVQLGAGAAAAVTAITASVAAVAKPLESLYYSAQRTGAGAAELQQFANAAANVGSSAEEAQRAVEALAAARRAPGGNFILNSIVPGLAKQADNVKVLDALLDHFQDALTDKSQDQLKRSFAMTQLNMLGGQGEFLSQLARQRPAFTEQRAEQAKIFGDMGIDPSKQAEESAQFMRQLRNMGTEALALGQIVGVRVMPALKDLFGFVEKGVGIFVKLDAKTGGLSTDLLIFGTALAGIAAAITTVVAPTMALMGAFEGIGTALGVAATIGGVLLPILAGIAATYELYQHRSAVESWGTKFLQKIGRLPADGPAGVSPDQASFTASEEGHAKSGYGQYTDAAGNPTVGFGHKLNPGESFAGLDKQGAMALLVQDLGKVSASVRSLVKVQLGQNQMKALTDLAFNIGAGALAKSTLLKDINAGDFAAAAAQFARFDKMHRGAYLVPNEGLARRNKDDANLFRTPDKGDTHISTTINVDASGMDAKSAATEIARQQNRVNGDLVRNLQPTSM